MMDNVKPGIKTTEFWMTLINTLLMVGVAFGLVNQSEAESLASLIAPLVAAIIPIVAYISSRTKVKSNIPG
jgi:hypothetical protein